MITGKFYVESYDGEHVTVYHWQKKLHRKLRKSGKLDEKSRIFENNQYFSALLDMFFHVNRSKIRCLSSEKTSKKSRNSHYSYNIIQCKNKVLEHIFGINYCSQREMFWFKTSEFKTFELLSRRIDLFW